MTDIKMHKYKRLAPVFLLASFAIVLSGVLLFIEPIPQPLEYHQFADTRAFFGINNFGDVVSNIGYAVVGFWGIWQLSWGELSNGFDTRHDRNLFVLFFAAVAIVSLGSGYYHATPDNDRLFWDRLPMTVAFMSLFCLVIEDHINRKFGKVLLWILIPAGILSLVYWSWTESHGQGDLRFYVLVQFFPIVAIPLICYFLPDHRYTPLKYILMLIVWYAGAKVLEFFDAEIFALSGNTISGHSLKHLCSAISVLVILRMLHFIQTRQ